MAVAATEEASISPKKLRDDLYLNAYQQHSTTPPLVISVLASLIGRTVARNHRIARNFRGSLLSSKDVGSTKVFECNEAPDMTIQSYLERVFRYTGAGPSVYVVAYVYMDRLCQLHPQFRIGPRNVHRLLITTIMVASKYVEDM